jgi:hypothetical protein
MGKHLQLPENILSNRFNTRQHDMHKKYAEQKLGETDAALNTSLKKITISPCTANGHTYVISTKCHKTVCLQPLTTVVHSLTDLTPVLLSNEDLFDLCRYLNFRNNK